MEAHHLLMKRRRKKERDVTMNEFEMNFPLFLFSN